MLLELEGVSASLAWLDPLMRPWFVAWGVPVTELEAWAFVMSVAMVGFNLRVNPLGWPLAIASSVLYGLLFARSRLYGEASLQLLFVVMSAWGWWQWLRGVDANRQALSVRTLTTAGAMWAILAVLAMWPAFGLLLRHITDSDVPYLDALPTSGSVVGQWLLARKLVENWPCWLAVNAVSMGLFAYKQLWLTVVLYGVFAVLSVFGWRAWRSMAAGPSEARAGA